MWQCTAAHLQQLTHVYTTISPGSIVPIHTLFQTTGSTRLAGGWLIFMMYSTLFYRATSLKRASLACSNNVCQLPLWVRGRLAYRLTMPTCEPRGRGFETRLPRPFLILFTFQSPFDAVCCLCSKIRTATRSCLARKRADHVYSPGVAATRHVWPAAAAVTADAAALYCRPAYSD